MTVVFFSLLCIFPYHDMILLAYGFKESKSFFHARWIVILMLTYLLSPEDSRPLYEQLVASLRSDILSGQLSPGSRLPSKRSFAENLGVSSITVENAYNRLIDEGYVVSEPKRGYFVEQLIRTEKLSVPVSETEIHLPGKPGEWRLDLSGNHTPPERFSFSVFSSMVMNCSLALYQRSASSESSKKISP